MFLTEQQWREDLTELARLVTDCCAHCWPGSENAKAFPTNVETIGSRLKGDLPIAEGVRVLRDLLNSVGDGHAMLVFPDQQSLGRKVRIPCGLSVLADEIVVGHDTPEGLHAGDKLMGVNGVNANELWNRYAATLSSPSPRVRRAFVNGFFWNTAASDVPWINDDWVLEVESLEGDLRKVKVCSEPLEGPENWRMSPVNAGIKDGTGWIKVPTFALIPGAWESFESEVGEDLLEFRTRASAYMFELLESLSGADRLIVDLRGNGGGMDYIASTLGQFLLEGPFEVYTLQRRHCAELHRRNSHWSPEGEGIRHTFRGGEIEGSREMPARQIHHRFEGPVAILMDEYSASATTNLMAYLKHYRPDIHLVGRECAGTIGDAMRLGELPNLGCGVILSTLRGWGPDGVLNEGRVLIPDVPVEWTRQDIGQRDPDVEAALRTFECR